MPNNLINISLPSCFQGINDILEFVFNVKELFIVLFGLFFFIIYIVTRWQRKINKTTQQKIEKLKTNGKYIEDIFIELNDSKESLRYFLNGKKWLCKIKYLYNSIFNSYIGGFFRVNLNKKILYPIPFYTSIKNFKVQAENIKLILQKIQGDNDEIIIKKDTGDLTYLIESSSFRYIDSLNKVLNYITMCNTNHMLALGSAGNGKTNLLCSFSELVIKYNQPCIFIDAKEIRNDIENLIIKEFKIPNFPIIKNIPLFFFFMCLFLFIKSKHLYIVIDALNENYSEEFTEIIKELLNRLCRYKRIKILISCRSEYFNDRFKNLFEEIDYKFFKYNINEEKYNTRAMEKTILNYQKHFNVKGNIHYLAKSKLFNSLILIRIFFKVNENKDINTLELRNAEIYDSYIKQINNKFIERNSNISFKKILEEIINIMLERNIYNGIPIADLNLNYNDEILFKSILDDNLIISKKIKEGSGITEREKEIVYFVFDELRDFCISRKILIYCDENRLFDYKELYRCLNNLNKNKLSPFEGILKYSYYYFKNNSTNPNRLEHCKKILTNYGKSLKPNIFDNENKVFNNYGILMIIEDCKILEDFEFQYIIDSMVSARDFINMLNILIDNEITGNGLKIDIFLKVLLMYTSEGIKDIIMEMIDENEYFITSENKDFINICNKILYQSEISNEIKWLLIIINEIHPEIKYIKRCILKFNIEEKDKYDFIKWLLEINYPKSDINNMSKLIKLERSTL